MTKCGVLVRWERLLTDCLQPAEWVTMRVCCEMGLYPALAEGGIPKTLGQLVEMMGADATLLRVSCV